MSETSYSCLWVEDLSRNGKYSGTMILMDLIFTLSVWMVTRLPATKLLIIFVGLRSIIQLPLLYACADYYVGYSNATCSTIVFGLQMGWFVTDHIFAFSTFHRLLFFNPSTAKKKVMVSVLFVVCIIGFILRCMKGKNIIETQDISYIQSLETAALINSVLGEFFMSGFLYFVYQTETTKKNANLKAECYTRLTLLPIFRVFEIVFAFLSSMYVKKQWNYLSVVWFTQLGLITRRMPGTVVSVLILINEMKSLEEK
ncbi:hypothetical protein BC833DRAFT_588695 [Globomyces pollinis-pini]|nr:hypothetical protein BC833DRAFT_588695 [Globomyces pollinis-pini]